MDKPTLDEAALADMCTSINRWASWTDAEKAQLLDQARLALTQAVALATLEAERDEARWMHATDCLSQFHEVTQFNAGFDAGQAHEGVMPSSPRDPEPCCPDPERPDAPDMDSWASGFAWGGYERVAKERDNLRVELAEESALRTRMGDILTLTVNALRGEPDSRSLHDWATLPEVARTLMAERDGLEADRVDLMAQVWPLKESNNALRDALEGITPMVEAYVPYRDPALGDAEGDDAENYAAVLAMRKALAQTPAASLAAAKDSLAAHDAEVLEPYLPLVTYLVEQWELNTFDGDSTHDKQMRKWCHVAKCALAAQEVKCRCHGCGVEFSAASGTTGCAKCVAGVMRDGAQEVKP